MKISCSLISSVSLFRRRTRDLQGGGVGGVPRLALFHIVLGRFIHAEIDEGQLQIALHSP